jgi:hypothetical protein
MIPAIHRPNFRSKDFFLVAVDWDTGRYAHHFLEWVGLRPNEDNNVVVLMQQRDALDRLRGYLISHVWVPRLRGVPSLLMYDNFQLLRTIAGNARFFYEDS